MKAGRQSRHGVADPITLTYGHDREVITMATRRWKTWLETAWMLLLAGMPAFCIAQSYPSKPIRLILTQGPGSGSDVIGRMLAIKLTESLGQSVVVENRTGATGIIGHEFVLKSPPDGYTLLLSTTAPLIVVPAISAQAKYRAADFVAVTPIFHGDFVIFTANLPGAPKTLQELVERLRAKPENFASAGAGTMGHLVSEVFLKQMGLQAQHIPYKGSGQSLNDLVGGQVLFTSDSTAAGSALLRAGRLNALVVTGTERMASLPQVPTLAESGIKVDRALGSFGGIFAPPGTPKEIVARLNAETARVLQNPDFKTRMAAIEVETLILSPEQFAEFVRQEASFWEHFVGQLGLKIE
jgi:tripartite-type tricarboxylate transporter receptor subunit TctC